MFSGSGKVAGFIKSHVSATSSEGEAAPLSVRAPVVGGIRQVPPQPRLQPPANAAAPSAAAASLEAGGEKETQLYSAQLSAGPPPAAKGDNGARSYGAVRHDADYDVEEERDEHGVRRKRITPYQAGWNVTNAIQGMFIVSLPYGVLHGGWWTIVALVGVAYICYYTGIILVDCLYDEKGQRVRKTYRDIAEAVWGAAWGGRLVLAAQITELMMTCILYVVLAGDLLEGSFPGLEIDKIGWMVVASIFLLPCALLTDITAVSNLSFWNTVSHVAINAIVLLYCLTRISEWHWGQVKFTFDIHIFPTVLGIVVFSYTDHIFLPTLEGSLADRSTFKPMLRWTHMTAAVFKALFGLIGFLTFGEFTQEEVPNNVPGQFFKSMLNLILVVKALLSYPLPFYATATIIEQNLFLGAPKTKLPSAYSVGGSLREWALAIRLGVWDCPPVCFTLIVALTVPHFALLMGLIGNITGTCLSFIWPSYFHLRIKHGTLSDNTRMKNWAIIMLGFLFGLMGLVYSSQQLINAMTAVDEYA